MTSLNDQQLLRAYAGNRSEPAFAELVRRYVDFVYSAALRIVRDPHLAEDVTQSVFVALARSSVQLMERSVLAGWLHRTTQNLASNSVRAEVRRRGREQEAVIMNELLGQESDAVWQSIAPRLDAALCELNPAEHEALLLRYFERKSAREMAQILDLTHEAAQKRVNRAVERLRQLFARQGVTVGSSALVLAISSNAVQAAPVAFAATISAAAVLTGTIATTTTTTAAAVATATLIKGLAMTTFQKTLIATVLAAAVGTGIYKARETSRLDAEVRSLQQQQQKQQQTSSVDQTAQLTPQPDATAEQTAELRELTERVKSKAAALLSPMPLAGAPQPKRVEPSVPAPPSAATQTQAYQFVTVQPEPNAEVWSYPPSLQKLAATNLDRALGTLTNAQTEFARYQALSETAKLAFVFGKLDDARDFATELLALDQKFQTQPWRGGDAAFYGNLVLGRTALAEGRIDDAKQHLLASGQTIGSPVLNTFGPNMTLARDLLKTGDRDTVLQYFDLCRKFWGTMGEQRLSTWAQEVNAGKIPDFGDRIY